MLLQLHLGDWDYFDKQIGQLENAMLGLIQQYYQQAVSLLLEVPGIGQQSACTIIAEVGNTLDSFPTADHFTSWAGLAPGNHQSANTWYAQHTTKGNKYFRTILIQVAWAAVRTKGGYWQAHFQYLRKRLPAKKAIVAIARKMTKLIYRVITQQYKYEEKGAAYFIDRLGKYHNPNNHPLVAG
jgi:transposase